MEKIRLTNNTGISLSMAVWLATDEYDYCEEEDYISVTSFLKAPRQLILGSRIESETLPIVDIARQVPSRVGTAIHNSIEDSWVNDEKRIAALRRLGHPEHVIDRIRVNPTKEELQNNSNIIPVYLEQRQIRQVGKFLIGGKFDFIANGTVEDFKKTGTWAFMSGTNDWKYRLQGSMYRWLNPEIVTAQHMMIQFIFLDWKAGEFKAKQNYGYPPHSIMSHRLPLIPLPEMEVWMQDKANQLDQLWDAPECDLPLCAPRDLWQDKSIFKYYKNPEKRSRATRRFETHAEAIIKWTEDGRVGVIEEVPGMVKACTHCPAFGLCSQKDSLIANGFLKLETA